MSYHANDNPTTTKDAAFREMTSRGITRAVAHFDGGNDEGGISSNITAYLNDGTVTEIPFHSSWDAKSGQDNVSRALESAVDDRYGSFAGEFYVQGHVVLDLTDRTLKVEAQESSTVMDDVEYDY